MSLSGRLFNNLPYKISAMFLASVIWYIVQGEEVLEINRKMQIILQVPAGYVVKGGNVRYKDVTLKGPRALLGNFSSRPIEARIKVTTEGPGEIRYRIDKEFIYNWDNRIRLTVHDPYLMIFVDEQLTKRIPVKEYFQGLPAEGFIIEKAVIQPPNIVITGLKSEIQNLQHILTDSIDISGLQKSQRFEIPLKTKGLEAALSADKVKVYLQVGEKRVNQRFEHIPIDIEGATDLAASVHPLTASIVIQGTAGVLNFLKVGDLRAFVDITGLPIGSKEKKVQVKIPPDTILVETIPSNVLVDLQDKKIGKNKVLRKKAPL